jgi:hypothetical protein
VRLEGERATGHAALGRFAIEQRNHRLVPTVHAVEITDRERTGGSDVRMAQSSENLHGAVSFW